MADYLILVVEDNKVQRMILEDHLQEAGYKVVHAENGAHCLEILEAMDPDLILLDVHMPVMDGFETLYAIRNNNKFSELPVLFLTSQEQDFKKIKGLELGADDYITKPFNSRILLSRIKAVLRRTEHYRQKQETMEGNLSRLPLPDLLQSLAQNSTTGSTVLQEMGGVIIMQNGFLVHVQQGSFTGEEAFNRLILLNRGPFAVRFDDVPDKISETPKPLVSALMQAMTTVDEVRDVISRIPAENPKVKICDDISEYPSLEKFEHYSPMPFIELIVLMEGNLMDNIIILNKASKQGKIKIVS
ncbi:MAG: response regulator [Desulfobacteraceae bacterium]|nr:response regulator [Desulfobacteraceae bacterium]